MLFEFVLQIFYLFAGAGSGTFCMDCSTSSNTSYRSNLGFSEGLCVLWSGFSGSDCIVPGMARSKDDEVQVQYSVFII